MNMTIQEAILKELNTFAANDSASVLTIEVQGNDELIQIQKLGDDWEIMLGTYPADVDPTTKFTEIGVKVPQGWSVSEWEEEGFAQFSCGTADRQLTAEFISMVFKKFYNCHNVDDLVVTTE